MNCFQARRELLAAPHARSDERDAHLESCADCSRVAERLGALDRALEQAALVPVPEGLAHRVLLAREPRPRWRYALAAALVAALVTLPLVTPNVMDTLERAGTAEAVGPAHPAVAAISLIADEEESLVRDAKVADAVQIEQSLKRLGLTLGKADGTSYYVGKCQMSAGECDHILLSTPDGYVNVLLLPEYAVAERLLVTDRRMTALVNSAPHGGYIVVGQSPKHVKRTERLFRRG